MPESTPNLAASIAKLKAHAENPHVCGLHNDTVSSIVEVAGTLDRVDKGLSRFIVEHLDRTGPCRHVERWEFEQLDNTVREGFHAMRETQAAQGKTQAEILETVNAHQADHREAAAGLKRGDKLFMALLQFCGTIAVGAAVAFIKAHAG